MTLSKLSTYGEIEAAVILHPGPLSDDDIHGDFSISVTSSNTHLTHSHV